jgi:hypothetical protein
MSYYGKLYVNDLSVITTASTPQLLVTNSTSGFTNTIKGSDSGTESYTLTLPVDNGTSGQSLTTDGSGVLSWAGGTGPDLTLTSATPTITLSGVAANLVIGDASDTITIAGKLVVSGTTTSINSENVLLADNFQLINADYSTNVAQSGGIIVNYEPTAVTQSGATGGVASTTTITVTAGASGFTAGDLILVTGAANAGNNGVYEFLSETAATPNVITIQGTPVSDFAQSTFVTDAADTGYAVTKTKISELSVDPSTGGWRVSSGETATAVNTYKTLVASGDTITDISLDPNSVTGDGLVIDNTASLSSGSLANISASGGQSGGDLVLITGVDGQSALNVADGNVSIADNLSVGGQLTADDIDSATATTMLLGKATATKVEIADTGVTTEVQGPLTTLEGITVTGELNVSGQIRRNVTTHNVTTTVLVTDNNIITSTTAAAVVLTLPTLSGSTDGLTYTFINTTGTNTLTISRGGTDTFADASTSVVLAAQHQSVQLTAIGTVWHYGF